MLHHPDGGGLQKPYLAWLLSLVAVGLLALSVNGCNTVSGMGKDMKAAGGAVSNTAQKTEDKMD
jgi:predicted small secreted protein